MSSLKTILATVKNCPKDGGHHRAHQKPKGQPSKNPTGKAKEESVTASGSAQGLIPQLKYPEGAITLELDLSGAPKGKLKPSTIQDPPSLIKRDALDITVRKGYKQGPSIQPRNETIQSFDPNDIDIYKSVNRFVSDLDAGAYWYFRGWEVFK